MARNNLDDFFVLNPGGGWRSKCWPAARYGELHRKLVERYGWRGVVSFGPGEESLAQEVISAAGDPAPVAIPLGIGPLMALMRRAKFVVSADTGPLASCIRSWRARDRSFWPDRSRRAMARFPRMMWSCEIFAPASRHTGAANPIRIPCFRSLSIKFLTRLNAA